MRQKAALSLAVLMNVVLLLPAFGQGTFTNKDLKALKKDYMGKVYLRIDVPCRYGRHAFASYVDPLVNVSPKGSALEGSLGANEGVWSMEGVFWGFGPNDPMEITDMGIDKQKIWVSMEGLGDKKELKNEEAVLNFVEINSADDFKAAFNIAFSRKPLQDEHDDWAPEIKKAISERKVVPGMTKRQAFCIVGTPASVTNSDADGKKVEIWAPRQSNGMHVRMRAWTTGTTQRMSGLPSSLKFVDGILTEIGAVSSNTAPASKVDLDK